MIFSLALNYNIKSIFTITFTHTLKYFIYLCSPNPLYLNVHDNDDSCVLFRTYPLYTLELSPIALFIAGCGEPQDMYMFLPPATSPTTNVSPIMTKRYSTWEQARMGQCRHDRPQQPHFFGVITIVTWFFNPTLPNLTYYSFPLFVSKI